MEIVKNGVTYSLNIQGAEKYDVNASDDDLKIFEHIKALCPDVQLERKTDNYYISLDIFTNKKKSPFQGSIIGDISPRRRVL